MAELYDTDVVEWSEHQARLLRQVASGKPGNEAPQPVPAICPYTLEDMLATP